MKRWFEALRVKHWIKNFFVFAPFLIGPHFGLNEFMLKSLGGTLVFAILSSAVYLFNDIIDLPRDRQHPEKRLRPIASGQISLSLARSVAISLALLSLLLAFLLELRFFVVLVAYGVNNLLYSYYLKTKTVLDVMSIAAGFVLRVYAGGYLIGVVITNWLVVCVFALSLFMGLGKRRAECEDLQGIAPRSRKVLESYTIPKLDLLLGISASITIVTYMLYTVSPETIALHRTDKLIFTTPFVVYCVYRFLLKVQEEGRGDSVKLILKDRGFLLAGSSWLVSILLFVHMS
jgi:4-hydroxybenzoate polyprenyltransferase